MPKPVDLFSLALPNIGHIAAAGLEHARDLLGFIFARFFTPEAIARDGWISRGRYRDFIRWLRIVEDMARRILFIEASAIASSLPPPAPPRRAHPLHGHASPAPNSTIGMSTPGARASP